MNEATIFSDRSVIKILPIIVKELAIMQTVLQLFVHIEYYRADGIVVDGAGQPENEAFGLQVRVGLTIFGTVFVI